MTADLLSGRVAALRTSLGGHIHDGCYFEPVAIAALCAVLDGLVEDAAALERVITAAIHRTAGPDADSENVIALAIMLDRGRVHLGIDWARDDGREGGR